MRRESSGLWYTDSEGRGSHPENKPKRHGTYGIPDEELINLRPAYGVSKSSERTQIHHGLDAIHDGKVERAYVGGPSQRFIELASPTDSRASYMGRAI